MEDGKFALRGQWRDIGELHAKAAIWCILAEAVHGLLIGHAWEGGGKVETAAHLESPDHHALHERHEFLDLRKGHLDIELRELGLAISAQVLISETAHDLEVAVKARDHQQLLEILRRLGQSIEFSRIEAARHQIIPRPFRGAANQKWRFDLEEAVG